MRLIFILLFVLASACAREEAAAPEAAAEEQAQPASFVEETEGMEHREGFFDLYLDDEKARVLAVLPAANDDGVMLRFIYATGLTSGLGSNPIGLDRGLFDSGSLVAFRRIGARVIAEKENWTYRSSAENELEKKAVRQSFASSFLWSGEIIAQNDSQILVDLSGFLTRDAIGVSDALKRAEEGIYSISPDLSAPDVSAALAFPDNIELDAYLTLTSSEPGDEVHDTAADGGSITLIEHHSFVRLPEEGFVSRRFDIRTGGIEIPYYDFSTELDEPVLRSFARRFRLEHADVDTLSGPAKKPIVIYVDSGAPEKVRNALIEGASWWASAFEAAGFPDSYRVEVLPDDAHPLDVRYNVIQWTHRQTRGWSYGGGVSDPRTGEMIKADVILGSQRVRQDRMIFEGLAGVAKTGTGDADDPVELALARIRQLAAHEIGHALGFGHNFAASSIDRASVMDYPAPYVRPTDEGGLDFSQSYGVGVGDWDKFTALWLYKEFAADTKEAPALEKIVRDGYSSGLRFVGDREGRSIGTGHPFASVWDNGADPIETLEETMEVRRIALSKFGPRSLPAGAPLADLRKIIVPIYLYHRYQTAAAAKVVGGLDFQYATRGDGISVSKPVADTEQRRALAVIVKTLDPAALDISDRLLNIMTPPLGGRDFDSGERFSSGSAPVFDVLNAADSAASVTMGSLMNPARAARLGEYERRNSANLDFADVLSAIEAQVFSAPASSRQRAIAQQLQTRFVSSLIELAQNQQATPGVRAIAEAKLRTVAGTLSPSFFGVDPASRDHRAWLAARIAAHLNRPAAPVVNHATKPEIPPGSPIGASMREDCWFCEPL